VEHRLRNHPCSAPPVFPISHRQLELFRWELRLVLQGLEADCLDPLLLRSHRPCLEVDLLRARTSLALLLLLHRRFRSHLPLLHHRLCLVVQRPHRLEQ
jgi:hypothetical protein